MSQQHPLPHSFQDLNQYLSSIPAPPPTNLGSYNVQTLTQVQASASGHDPDSTSYHPGAFSPSQLSALLDERILELGALPITEADMNLGGIDFPALQRYVTMFHICGAMRACEVWSISRTSTDGTGHTVSLPSNNPSAPPHSKDPEL